MEIVYNPMARRVSYLHAGQERTYAEYYLTLSDAHCRHRCLCYPNALILWEGAEYNPRATRKMRLETAIETAFGGEAQNPAGLGDRVTVLEGYATLAASLCARLYAPSPCKKSTVASSLTARSACGVRTRRAGASRAVLSWQLKSSTRARAFICASTAINSATDTTSLPILRRK